MSNNDPYQSFATSGNPRPIDDVVHSKVTSRKNELMKMDPAGLRNLPECTAESFEANGKRFELTTWHEEIGSAEQLFVVQCKRTIFLGIGNMHVEGFVLGPKGEIRDAEENLLWDFS